MFLEFHRAHRRAVVAIPAHNEAGRIKKCLAALAVQRDEMGAPIAVGRFQIIIFANNCSDGTADIVRKFSSFIPHPVHVIEESLPGEKLNAGWARKRAMDLASIALGENAERDLILTTDADSCVEPTWLAGTFKEFENEIDCVAGYIDAQPMEILTLGPTFLSRSRLEDTYLRLAAEIYALCDPRSHDPWPNHRVSSGASLAVTQAAYLSVGGLPARPLGEDIAFTTALDRAGFKIRHSMSVSVATSCRFDGRAQGGAGDTMRHRHNVPDTPCDDDIEPALPLTRRAIFRGSLRKCWTSPLRGFCLPRGLELRETTVKSLLRPNISFEEAWTEICCESPALNCRNQLRPSDLPRQIAIAKLVLLHLLMPIRKRQTALTYSLDREESHERAV